MRARADITDITPPSSQVQRLSANRGVMSWASRLIMTVSREPQNHQQKSLLGQAFVDPTETLTRLGGDTELPPSLRYFTTKLEEKKKKKKKKKIVCVL